MAKKAAKKAVARSKSGNAAEQTDYTLDVDCAFGTVGVGETVARIGVRIDRGACALDVIDEHAAGKRVKALLSLKSRADRGQKRLRGMEGVEPQEFEREATIKGYTVNAKRYGLGLAFETGDLALAVLQAFVKRGGTLRLAVVGDADADAEDDGEDGDGRTLLDGEDDE